MTKIAGAGASIFPRGQKDKCYTHLRAHVRDIGIFKLISVAMLTTNSVFLNAMRRPVGNAGGPGGVLKVKVPFAGHPVTLRFSCGIGVSSHRGHVHTAKFDGVASIPNGSFPTTVLLLRGH